MTSNTYDLILVFGFSRAHNHYLNIVKYLSPDYKIGIYFVNAENRGNSAGAGQMIKVQDTDDLFLSCLKSFGAEILEEGRYECSLLVLPQVAFNPEFLKDIRTRIKRKRTIALQTFGYGIQLLQQFNKELGVSKLFVYDKIIFDNKLSSEDKTFLDNNFEVIEMGCPFNKYPVFNDIEIDYMVAYPTALLIKDEYVRNTLLVNILKLISSINKNERVVLKLHNVRDSGNKIFKSYDFFNANQFQGLFADGLRAFASFSSRLSPDNKMLTRIIRLSNHIRHSQIEKKSSYLSDMTPYFNFGLELFLPSVKKGLITGISSSIWYALYNKLPVYNCDDQTFTKDGIVNSSTYESFYVSPCKGKLEFSQEDFNKIPASARDADLLELIKHNI